VRLNLGCGHRLLEGWTNVDAVDVGQDYVCDLRQLPFEDESVDEAMAIHVVEHFYVWDVPGLLTEWHRVLKPGGRLVLECPDLKRIVRNINEGSTDPFETLLGLYGDIRHQNAWHQHKWCWTAESLVKVLTEQFSQAFEAPAEYHLKDRRDLRVVAVK